MIRKCSEQDVNEMWKIINDGAQAYKGIIPEDQYHDPYMSMDELLHEIESGVMFWGVEHDGELVGVMGLQDKGDVALIRHAYVRTVKRKGGIGTQLLRHIAALTEKPILIGTWEDAGWAISFYTKNGYTLVPQEKKKGLLQRYWQVSDRQIETSVVLASPGYNDTGAVNFA
ncbi:GNAT family N-acetyltransferase [Paenibacillus nanensis]|uniref:GNAT family N-acetyltransferase n=1 Tax=Paenibacillus nanensis TaxID=393251 RepID=A0A3A1UT60_9BACL|nr:GNAT family N-acetyltransferase [Paenibacillus nanensis]RIX51435.1 GNAT family N-acetyltransferase [Paenibacillus nanensis]